MPQPERFWNARLQLHWAAQAVAGVGRTLLAQRPDDSQTSFTWSDGALMQEEVDGKRAGLRMEDLTLLVGADSFPMHGHTLDDGFAFLESHFGRRLNRSSVDLPDHPVAHGARFDAEPADCLPLAKLYAEADSLLRSIEGGSPVRCWPHHFDIATLIDLGDSRTIGAGLTPGEEWYHEPYWYVTPWPYPEPSVLAALPIGHWHTERWTGAVLLASEGRNPRAFVEEAVARCRQLLGSKPLSSL